MCHIYKLHSGIKLFLLSSCEDKLPRLTSWNRRIYILLYSLIYFFLQRITQTVISSENPTVEKSVKIEKEDLLYDKQKKKAAAKVELMYTNIFIVLKIPPFSMPYSHPPYF